MRVDEARAGADIEVVRRLFVDYAAELGVDLGFQRFDAELAGLPGAYARPSGRLLLARDGEEVLGCVALRRFSDTACEMKRLYVRPGRRRGGTGRALAVALLAEARAIGYRSMLLDTLSHMVSAVTLYESLGFSHRDSYYDTPLAGTVFMELAL